MNKKQLELEALKCRTASCLYWVKYDEIVFPPNNKQDFINFIYQVRILGKYPRQKDLARKTVIKKPAQVGETVMEMITQVHGCKYGHYPNGVLHLFPTDGDAERISKTKLQPLIDNNPATIKRFVGKPDEVMTKKIGKGYLFYQGARETRKLDDSAGSSSKLKSITVDRLDVDEYDEMDMDMVELAKYRISQSKIKEENYYSTPTLPDYGIDKMFQESDQSVWMIKCSHCSKYTCLELEFPDCLIETSSGDVFRICKHCREPLSVHDIIRGEFIPQVPSLSKDLEGRWMSSLSIPNRSMKDIYKKIQSTDPVVLKNVYNSDLAMPFMQSDDALTKGDVFNCCGNDAMQPGSARSSAMGVDVKGKVLHVVVGYPVSGQERYKITYIARVSSFRDVHDIAMKHKVKCAAICYEPDTRKVREFRNAEPYAVYLIDYQDALKKEQKVDEASGIMTIRRTETMDRTANLVRETGHIELPRRGHPEIERYAFELSRTVKVLQEDKMTGSRRYVWKKIGDEDYFHSTNYFIVACKQGEIMPDFTRPSGMYDNIDERINEEYDPLRI